jgi:hypothetical protein
MKIYSDAMVIALTDGTPEALEYGLEVARENLTWSEDNICGLDVDSESVDFSCSKRFSCPLKNIVKVSI